MQTLKRPISMLMAVTLCLTLLSGIVLPKVAETALAADIPAYEMLDDTIVSAQSVTLSVPQLDSEGNVTKDENGDIVYVDDTREDVYVINDTEWLLFVDSSYKESDIEKIADADGQFFYTYGDGETWGTGKTYLVQYNETFFTHWNYMQDEIRSRTPKVDQDCIVLLAPGYIGSTNSPSRLDGVNTVEQKDLSTFQLPLKDDDTPYGVDEITEDELLNIYFYGPKSGKAAVGEDGTINPDGKRSYNTEEEWVFTHTMWMPRNAVYHIEGCAGRNSTNFFNPEYGATISEDGITAKPVAELTEEEKALEVGYLQGMYIDNMYCYWGGDYQDKAYELFRVGDSLESNTLNSVIFEVTNSAFDDRDTDQTGSNQWHINANRAKIDNCIFAGFNADPEYYNSPFKMRLVATNFERTAHRAFYGDHAGKYSFTYTNNIVTDMETWYGFGIRYSNFLEYGTNASFTWDNNVFENFGAHYTSNRQYLLYTDWNVSKQVPVLDENGAETGETKEIRMSDSAIDASSAYYDEEAYEDWEKVEAQITFTNNEVSLNTDVSEKKNTWLLYFSYMPTNSTKPIITGNTFKAKVTDHNYSDVAACGPAVDLSGNLFLNEKNEVREAHVNGVTNHITSTSGNYTTDSTYGNPDGTGRAASGNNAKVHSDIYASDEMAGGLREIFALQESPEGLLILNSDVQVNGDDDDHYEYIRGTLTVLPHHEKTYRTENLFKFNNENVELVGVYRDANCRYPLESIDKAYFAQPDDGTVSEDNHEAYVMAKYTAGSTTATVVFRMVMPTKYIFIVGDDDDDIANITYPVTATVGEDGKTTYEGVFDYTFNGDTYTLDMSNAANYTVKTVKDNGVEKDGGYMSNTTVNGVDYGFIAKGYSYGTAENYVGDPSESLSSSNGFISSPLTDVIVFMPGVHSTGSSLENGWTYNISRSYAAVGSGFDLGESAVIQEDTVLDVDVTVDREITIGGVIYTAGSTIAAGTELKAGDPNPKYADADLVSYINRGEYWIQADDNEHVYFTMAGVSLGSCNCWEEVLDADGNLTYEVDSETGELVLDDEGNPIVIKQQVQRNAEINFYNNTSNVRFQMVNLQNVHVTTPNLMHQSTAVNHMRQSHIYIEDMYYNHRYRTTAAENGTALNVRVSANTFIVNKSVIYQLGNDTYDSQNRFASIWSTDPTKYPCNPYASTIRILNTNFVQGNGHVISACWRYVPNVDKYYGGLEFTMSGCTAYDFPADLMRVQSGAGNSVRLKFTDNYIYNVSKDTSHLIQGYIDKADTTMYPDHENAAKFRSADISGNVIINRSAPWDLNYLEENYATPNAINVDENVYLRTDGEGNLYAKAIEGDDGYIKSDWYYMVEDFSIKSTDLYPLKGNFGEVTITENGITGEKWTATLLTVSGGVHTKDDFAVKEGAVIEFYTDDTFTTLCAEDATFSGTAYARITYTSETGKVASADWILNLSVPQVWETYGLAPLTKTETSTDPENGEEITTTVTETYVDLYSQELYADRPGATGQDPAYTKFKSYFVAVAPDWTKYAHSTYEGALNNGTEDLFTELQDAEDDDIETADTILHLGDEFYAKMPTTGIIYRLRYGYTASDINHCHPYVCHTMLFFPGEYAEQFVYETNNADIYLAEDTYGPYYSDSVIIAADTENGIEGTGQKNGIGRQSYMTIGLANTVVRLIGPQAGISAANTATGTIGNDRVATDTETEAYFKDATTHIFVRNRIYEDGATLTIDGISGGSGWKVDTAKDDGSKWHNSSYASNQFTICIQNSILESTSGSLPLYAKGSSITNYDSSDDVSEIVNKAYACGALRIEDCYVSQGGSNKANLDSIDLIDSVIKTTDTAGLFYINPSRGDYNKAVIDLNYTAKGCYIEATKGYLYGVYFSSTTALEDYRTGLNVAFEDNYVYNLCTGNTNTTRDNLFIAFAGATHGKTTLENLAAKKYDIVFRNNILMNDTDTELASNRTNVLTLLVSTNTETADISGNTFYGYNAGGLFSGLSANCDVSENLYYAADGTLVSGNTSGGSISDVMLYDYEHRATDFYIVGGATEINQVTWTDNEPMDTIEGLSGSIRYPYTAGMTVQDILEDIRYAADNVESKGLYTHATCAVGEEVTELAGEGIYYLKVGYTDDNTVPAVYAVQLGKDVGYPETKQYTGDRIYLVPQADTGFDEYHVGDWIKYELDLDGDGVKESYYFVVGTNITNAVTEVPLNKLTGEYDVYLFDEGQSGHSEGVSYTYTADDISLNDTSVTDKIYNFYGAQKDVSPVVLDETTGRPTNVLSPQRDKSVNPETVLTGDFYFNYGTRVTINGVTFEGAQTRVRQASSQGDVLSSMSLYYCVTLDSALSDTSDSFVHLKANSRHTGTFRQNYMKFSPTAGTAGLIVMRHPYNVTIDANYLELSDTACTKNMIWIASMDSYNTVAYADPTNVKINNNTMMGSIHVSTLRSIYTLDWDIVNNELIPNMDADQTMLLFATFDQVNATFDLTLQDNVFRSVDGINGLTAIQFNSISANDIRQRISGNLFDNTYKSYVYGIDNASSVLNEKGTAYNFIADFSNNNTFTGFTYNYGDAAYMDHSHAAKNYVTGERVLFSGYNKDSLTGENTTERHAKFIFTETAEGFGTFALNTPYEAGCLDGYTSWSMRDTPASGHEVVDNENLRLLDVVIEDETYHFNPGYGMFIRIVDKKTGNLYYNSVPIADIDFERTNTDANGNERTFGVADVDTAICAPDGTTIGDTYNAYLYLDPIQLFMNSLRYEDLSDEDKATAEKPFGTYWRGNVLAAEYTEIADLIDLSGMRILDYGMLYGTDPSIGTITQEEVQNLATETKITTETGAYKKVSYVDLVAGAPGASSDPRKTYAYKYADGSLSGVFKLYSFRFRYMGYDAYRYGRMYLTFKIGDKQYTVFSENTEDLMKVTTPSATE